MIKSGFSRRGAQGPQGERGPQGKVDYTPILLAANGWDENNEQTVTVLGVSASEVEQLIQPIPASACRESYEAAGVRCVAQAANSLTFSCDEVPESDLTVFVVITELTSDSPHLTFTSPSEFTLAVANQTKNWDGTLEYSVDSENWAEWDGTTTLSSKNGYLALRGTGNSVITGGDRSAGDAGLINGWVLTGSNIACGGNIETLLDYATVANDEHPQMGDCCFMGLFFRNSSLVSAPDMPSPSLTVSCYEAAYKYCDSLVTAPELPAMNLAERCCRDMFAYDTALINAPELPAKILVELCFSRMYRGCISLKTPSAMAAETLAPRCCLGMYAGCTSLERVVKLPVPTLVWECYYLMYSGCTSLKISETQDSVYRYPVRIPASGTGTDAQTALDDMFSGTGGTFTGTPTINTTYYTDHEPVGA